MNNIWSVFYIIIAGYLNYDMQPSSTPLHGFCGTLGLTNVIRKPKRLNLITLAMILLDVILILSNFSFASLSWTIPLSNSNQKLMFFASFLIKKLVELRYHKPFPQNKFRFPNYRWLFLETVLICILFYEDYDLFFQTFMYILKY